MNSILKSRIAPEAVAASRLLDAGHMILGAIGEKEPLREGLVRTPERFAKAMAELCSGYGRTPQEVVDRGLFPAEGPGLIAVRDVELYSLCEHHLLPFWGTASVAYYPGEKIVGLSKIPRLVDLYARRLQVQERLTRQIAESLFQLVSPRAVAVRVRAQHMCMRMRGVGKQGGDTSTEIVLGEELLTPRERERLWHEL